MSSVRQPRFQIGDRVRVVWPERQGRLKSGVVIDVLGSPGHKLYRYRVKFADDAVETFFGFELENENDS